MLARSAGPAGETASPGGRRRGARLSASRWYRSAAKRACTRESHVYMYESHVYMYRATQAPPSHDAAPPKLVASAFGQRHSASEPARAQNRAGFGPGPVPASAAARLGPRGSKR
jgi:hypothetical protein